MNNPIVTGSKNNTNRLSILIPKANAVNPNQNSSQFHSNPTLDCVVDTTIPIRRIIFSKIEKCISIKESIILK